MDNNYDEHIIIMQSTIESNKQGIKSNKQDFGEKNDESNRRLQTNACINHHINDWSD